ncbi:MAG: hypothetical protein JJT82_03065 [Legionellaceae bacterium]|nr:hypothetical protein [Legionellaceae bacterium]
MIGAFLHSFIFAKVLGLYMIVMAIAMLANASYYRDVLKHMDKEKTAVLAFASFSLVFGLFLISIHNMWAWEAYVVVTLTAWFIVIKSVCWLTMPNCMISFSQKMFSGRGYYVAATIFALLGVLILSYSAFFVPLIE